MFRALARRLEGFRQDRKGNVAILFGLALVPLLLAVGIAVDYGRSVIVRERLSAAAHSAALAIGSWPGLTQAELKVKAQEFFDANYPASKMGTAGKVDVVFSGDDIQVSVKGKVPTTFMKLANLGTIDVGASSTVTKKQRNIELALVLDTTGSMDQSGKMTAMKNAAKKMVEKLFDGKTTSETLKVAVVPFAAAVNVGTDKESASWIDKDGKSAVSTEDFNPNSGVKVLDLFKKLKAKKSSWAWTGCVREREGTNYELTDATPSTGTAASLFAPYFAPDEPDKESNTTNHYITDKNCSGNDSDYEKKQRCHEKYNSITTNGSGEGPNFNCPPNAITPLTNTRNTVTSAINALSPYGRTVIPAGLLWGWRVLSPTAPYTEGTEYGNEKWIKALVLLTDGDNDVGKGGVKNHNKAYYNAFGYPPEGHLGKTNGSDAEATLNSKTSAICTAVKNKNVLVYTIGFQVNSATQTLLKNCASEDEKGNKLFYNSPSNDQLETIFVDIAQGLGELRIAK